MSSPSAPFSAVIVTYKTGPALNACLAALLDAPGCGQIILVNNGNSKEVVDGLEQLANVHEKVVLLDGHGNIGFGAGCNLGAAQARHGALVFINPDCLLDRDTLGAFDEALRLYPDAVLGGALRNEDGSEQRGARRGPLTLWSACLSFTGLARPGAEAGIWRDFNRHREPFPQEVVDMPVVSGALLAMRAATFQALNGFDPAYFLHVEDIDLCTRAWQVGRGVKFVPKATALHLGGTSDVRTWTVETAKIKSFLRYFWTQAHGVSGRVAVLLVMPFLASAVLLRALAVSGK